MTLLEKMTHPQVAACAARCLLVLPLGATEQHGPHLPLGTDTAVADELAQRLGRLRADVLVAPALAYGSSGEHAGFAGTLSLGAAVLEHAIVELVRSADAFAGVVIVCGHGGNAEPLAKAEATLRSEGRSVLTWMPRLAGADAHAGHTETSLMLAIDGPHVALDRAEAGDQRPISELLPMLRRSGVAAVSPNGVLGDPTGASVDDGRRLLDALAADLARAVERTWPVGAAAAVGPHGT